jgi:hypothetical protein
MPLRLTTNHEPRVTASLPRPPLYFAAETFTANPHNRTTTADLIIGSPLISHLLLC